MHILGSKVCLFSLDLGKSLLIVTMQYLKEMTCVEYL
jgi:hypothetical protein